MKQIGLPKGYFALVDDGDYEWLSQFNWNPVRSGKLVYANAWIEGATTAMHRLIAGPAAGLVVDHINHNGLDNRRENLRVCTQAENVRRRRPHGKSSKYRGVSRSNTKSKPWWAMIRVNDKQKNLGSFLTEDEAARAYDRAAFSAWGPSAYLNFPNDPQQALVSEYLRCHPLSKGEVDAK